MHFFALSAFDEKYFEECNKQQRRLFSNKTFLARILSRNFGCVGIFAILKSKTRVETLKAFKCVCNIETGRGSLRVSACLDLFLGLRGFMCTNNYI